MCDCLVTVDPETLLARTISQQIDRELLRAKQERHKEHIILLLGTSQGAACMLYCHG